MRDAVPPQIPVTVKMRRGLDDTPHSRDNFYTIFDGAFARGVAAITVHGRTVQQRYVGPSRWEFLKEVKRHAGTRTVLGSGDLFTAADCLEMMKQTGVDGVTAARGAIGNPWIFAKHGPWRRAGRCRRRRACLSSETLSGALRLSGADLRPGAVLSADAQVRDQVLDSSPADAASPRRLRGGRQTRQWQGVLDRWYGEDLPGVRPPKWRTTQTTVPMQRRNYRRLLTSMSRLFE